MKRLNGVCFIFPVYIFQDLHNFKSWVSFLLGRRVFDHAKNAKDEINLNARNKYQRWGSDYGIFVIILTGILQPQKNMKVFFKLNMEITIMYRNI